MSPQSLMELLSVKEYDIYIPLTYNDGSPVEGSKIERIGEMLLKQFGGITFFQEEILIVEKDVRRL